MGIDAGCWFYVRYSLYGAVKLTKNDVFSANILGMVLDLMHEKVFHCLMVMGLAKTL